MQETVDKTELSVPAFDVNYRSYAEVLEIAQQSISMLQDDETATRADVPERTLDLEQGVKVVTRGSTRAGDGDGGNDTLLYVINFKDNQGFSVVSACRQTDGLLAVVESGNYDPAVPTGNPGFDSFMTMARLYVENESQTPIAEPQSGATRASDHPLMCKPVCDTLFYEKVSPKISVKWGQERIMALHCPGQHFSGCASTAAAQVMSYFKYPNSLTLTYPERDVDVTDLDWTEMCKNVSTSSSVRNEADLQIARLARELGKRSNSVYYDDGTDTRIENIRSVLSALGYSVSKIRDMKRLSSGVFEDGDMYSMATALSRNELIIMRGVNCYNEGHEWVIDGCYYVKARSRIMATYDGETWEVYQEMYTHKTCHNHINWGWDGHYNGYFNGWVFDAREPLVSDSEYEFKRPTSEHSFTIGFRCFTITK